MNFSGADIHAQIDDFETPPPARRDATRFLANVGKSLNSTDCHNGPQAGHRGR